MNNKTHGQCRTALYVDDGSLHFKTNAMCNTIAAGPACVRDSFGMSFHPQESGELLSNALLADKGQGWELVSGHKNDATDYVTIFRESKRVASRKVGAPRDGYRMNWAEGYIASSNFPEGEHAFEFDDRKGSLIFLLGIERCSSEDFAKMCVSDYSPEIMTYADDHRACWIEREHPQRRGELRQMFLFSNPKPGLTACVYARYSIEYKERVERDTLIIGLSIEVDSRW